jgi:hypothetical protein
MGFFRVVGGILLAVVTIGLAGAIYQTGFMAGAAGTAGAANPAVVGPFWGWGWGWGFGGGLFHLLGLLFFLFLFFGLLRLVFGGHRRGWGPGPRGYGRGWGPYDGDHHGPDRFGAWEDRARQVHDDWHRRQDAAAGAPGSTGTSGSTGSSGPATSDQAGGTSA